MNYWAFGLTLQSDISFDTVLQPSSTPVDIVISENLVPEKANQQTRIYRRGVQAKFGLSNQDFLLNWAGIGRFKSSEGKRIDYQNLGADEGTLRLFLLSEVIGLTLFQRGLFLLHGSAVQVGDEALVFLGIPGAGKSTTAAAFAKAGHIVLSDDLVAIQLIDNKAHVIPAFGQYKIWQATIDGLGINNLVLEPSFEGATKYLVNQPFDKFPNQPIPLREITLLYPPKSRIADGVINPLHAPVELIRHFPLPKQLVKPSYLPKHFQDAISIARSARLTQMKRKATFSLLEEWVNSF
ncbi:hypothetical protein GCM10028806_12230 [Spirosoma terrae]|uniref:Serine kinase n=1 Tax=Spirosoma terrae TaxID=1968276 RepID=A0A6L9L396_9BACT|nr:serine kinase [Spirosoma terrae]NDU94880.1 serine kinase [Spirosoma terrae]